MEGVEGNSDGQRDIAYRNRDTKSAEQMIEVSTEEPGIFKKAKQKQVYNNSEHEDLTSHFFVLVHQEATDVVHQDTVEHQKNVHRLAPRIENQTTEQKGSIF